MLQLQSDTKLLCLEVSKELYQNDCLEPQRNVKSVLGSRARRLDSRTKLCKRKIRKEKKSLKQQQNIYELSKFLNEVSICAVDTRKSLEMSLESSCSIYL